MARRLLFQHPMDQYRLTAECFVVSLEDQRDEDERFLVYLPLRRQAFTTNRDGAALMSRLRAGIGGDLNPRVRNVVDFLVGLGAVNGDPDPPPAEAPLGAFSPTEVTLFLTSDCNLRCRYCYARGGESASTLSWEIALAASKLVIENAAERGSTHATITFHGGGEPTLQSSLMKRVVARARREAEDRGVEVTFGLTTNGVVSPGLADWIARTMSEVIVSCDGPARVHDLQRPLISGGGSLEKVDGTIRRLGEAGVPLTLRSTVTRAGAEAMAETTDLFAERYRPRVIHFEPVSTCGRARNDGIEPCPAGEFIAGFEAASRRARLQGVGIFYSGARIDTLSTRFCGAAAQAFTVTPEGSLTACYEVSRPDDPRAPQFLFGAYDRESRGFRVDRGKLRELSELDVTRSERCADCICKWHCAGDCPAKRVSQPDLGSGGRCAINVALTRHLVTQRLIDGKKKEKQRHDG